MARTTIPQIQHVVILPNGVKHDLPYALFCYYSALKLIRVSKKHRHVAHVVRGLRAWPSRESAILHFELIVKTAIDRDAIGSSWAAVLKACPFLIVDESNADWQLYGALEQQFGNHTLDRQMYV